MAAYTAQFAKHVTATAATVDSFLFSSYGKGIRIQNRTAASTTPVWFTVGKDVAGTIDPTSAGDNTYVLAPFTQGSLGYIDIAWPAASGGSTCCVKTLTAATDALSVMVLSEPFG